MNRQKKFVVCLHLIFFIIDKSTFSFYHDESVPVASFQYAIVVWLDWSKWIFKSPKEYSWNSRKYWLIFCSNLLLNHPVTIKRNIITFLLKLPFIIFSLCHLFSSKFCLLCILQLISWSVPVISSPFKVFLRYIHGKILL